MEKGGDGYGRANARGSRLRWRRACASWAKANRTTASHWASCARINPACAPPALCSPASTTACTPLSPAPTAACLCVCTHTLLLPILANYLVYAHIQTKRDALASLTHDTTNKKAFSIRSESQQSQQNYNGWLNDVRRILFEDFAMED